MLIRIQSARRIWAGSFFYAKNMQAPPKGPSKLSKLPARICTTKQFSTSQNTCNSYSSILAKMSDHNPGFVEPTGPAPATCKVVSAATVADKLLQEVKSSLQKFDRAPLLVGFLANNDPAARMYANWTEKTCTQNGFKFELREVDKEDLEDNILSANVDDNVDGIIVYFPVFGNRQDQYLQQVTAMNKDVEGLSHKYLFNMYQNIRFLDAAQTQKSILPCTPLAVIKILEHIRVYNSILPYGNRLFGKTITVVNRSEIVGRPLAALLANDGASVYSVDITGIEHFTRGEGIRKRQHQVHSTELKLEDVVPRSDVVITGVPSKDYKFPTHLLKEGAICINFSSEKNFDPSVKEKASIYVPAIGKVTITVLLRNILRLAENRRGTKQVEEGKSA